MNVLIVGCGRVGSRLAVELAGEGNEVTLIDRNPSAARLVKGGQQIDQRRFAGACRPDERDHFTRARVQAHIAQNGPVRPVTHMRLTPKR